MARPLLDRLNLNPRERRLVGILGIILLVLVVVGIPVFVQSTIMGRRSDVADARAALDAVQAARGQLRDRQAKKDAITSRYANKAPPLAGFLEQQARAQKIDLSDSVDRPEVPIGTAKKYTERNTVVHLKKAGMLAVAKFLESIEKSGHPILVSRLQIRKRVSEPDSYDVELGVSAYDRNAAPPKKEKEKEEKP